MNIRKFTKAEIAKPISESEKDSLVAEYTFNVIQGIKIDLRRINDKHYLIKKLYQIISNPERPTDPDSFQWRVNAVRFLEKALKTDFVNSRDFRRKIEDYLKNYEVRKGSAADRIKKARKKKKLTQKQLAEHLGFKTHVTIGNYEKGKRYPGEKVFEWLKEAGV